MLSDFLPSIFFRQIYCCLGFCYWNITLCSWFYLGLLTAEIFAVSFLLCVFSFSDFLTRILHSNPQCQIFFWEFVYSCTFRCYFFAFGRLIVELFIARLFAVVLSVGEVFVAGPFIMRLSAVKIFVIRAFFEQIFAIRLLVVITLSRI